MINKAINFATKKHKGQKDDLGFPYIYHCSQVFSILEKVTDNRNILCAALLHDTIEDTNTTYEELVKEFNKPIADLVMEVTHEGKKDTKGYWFPCLHSQEGIMIKFADRLSNLSRMESWDEKRKAQYLRKSKFWLSE